MNSVYDLQVLREFNTGKTSSNGATNIHMLAKLFIRPSTRRALSQNIAWRKRSKKRLQTHPQRKLLLISSSCPAGVYMIRAYLQFLETLSANSIICLVLQGSEGRGCHCFTGLLICTCRYGSRRASSWNCSHNYPHQSYQYGCCHCLHSRCCHHRCLQYWCYRIPYYPRILLSQVHQYQCCHCFHSC